jgi:hypothetical protein
MSLILTSNNSQKESGNLALNSGLNLPYQYHNYLANTLEIEPNSEVAVQSVKINKEGTINVNRSNNQYFIYVGQTAAVNVFDLPLYWTTSTPMHTFVNDDTRGSNATFNSNQMAEAIQDSMNEGVFHPNLLLSDINVSGCKCLASRNAKMLDFLGFDFQFNISSNTATDNKATMGFDDGLTSLNSAAGVWDNGAFTITNTQVGDATYTEMIAKAYPISHTDGTFETSYKQAGALWEIGLTRFLEKTATDAEQNPPYFSELGAGQSFYDYLVKSVYDTAAAKYYLRVYHSIVDTNNAQMIKLTEFDYTHVTALIETFATSGEYGTGFQEIKFTIKNEQVTLAISNTAPKGTTHTLALGTNAAKAKNLKPTATTTKFLYPKVRMFGGEGGIVTIKEYKSVKVTDFVYGDNRNREGWNRILYPQDKPNNMDFWCKLAMTGQETEVGWPVDSRYMFDYDDTTSGPDEDGSYTQLGANGNNGINASIVMVLRQDNDHGEYYGFSPSVGANAQSIFGFDNVPVVRIPTTSSESGNKISYISTNIPKMVSTNSTFVRLDNFSQLSFNAATGSPSKILYHLPRFTNSGEEFGGLYFEPTERTYVKLGNPNKLSINDFSVTLVNADETLANNLTGKTIVMFHIRKSR